MCVVSMVMDHYWDKWQPYVHPGTGTTGVPMPNIAIRVLPSVISDEEIAEFRKLLERAREYDKRNNEPDCELEEKRSRLKKLAEELGVRIEFI